MRIFYCFLILVLTISTTANAFQSNADSYLFDGTYYDTSSNSSPFHANQILDILIYEDAEGDVSIDELLNRESNIEWHSSEDIVPQKDMTYWLRTKLLGSDIFNGNQLFHVAPTKGEERCSYDFIEIYVCDGKQVIDKQVTGDRISFKERSFEFWATFFNINIPTNDTLDVYIKMSGADPYYPMSTLKLWHIDPASVFPSQLTEAKRQSTFQGVLAIQLLFFLCLFFIEKERIHLIFSALILGAFLTLSFRIQNFIYYFPFPNLKDFQIPLFILGVFMMQLSLLKFAEAYFNHSSSSYYSKKLIPISIGGFGIVNLVAVIYFRLFSFNLTIFVPVMLFSLMVMIPFFKIAYKARTQSKILKKIFFIAFIPIFLTAIPIMGVGTIIASIFGTDQASSVSSFPFLFHMFQLAMIFMILVLALSIGYRTNLLKTEKEEAQQNHLADQKIIIENKIQAAHLKQLNLLKNQFYTNITHEFRTPLTVIMGLNHEMEIDLDQVKASDKLKTRLKKSVDIISRNSNNLLQLINQLLDLSKSDSGLLKLDLKQDNIIPYLNYLTESFLSAAQEKNIRLVFYSEVQKLVMDFDETKIQHLVYNLLSNALKFTESGGNIVFHALSEEEHGEAYLILKVSDNGVGIPSDKLPYIFDRFYQIDSSTTRKAEGTGIGLALTRELVHLMQGEITAESEVRKGTTIRIILPVSQEAELRSKETLTKKKVVPKVNADVDLVDSDDGMSYEDGPLLLIVEDNLDVRHYLKQILEQQYHVETAENGEEGIAKALKLTPDIIISDVMMPKKDGFELTEVLKKNPITSHIPIILLTAKATDTNRIDGLRSGADAYLVKPFNKDELTVRIEKLLNLRKVMQKHYAEGEDQSMVSGEKELEGIADLSMEDFFIEKLRSLVMDNLDDPNLNVETMAKSADLSPSQLYRKLKALTNETPNTFIRNIRLKRGKELLGSTDLNIAEIAYKVGFKDPNYFSRSFHSKYGKSPKTYR